VDDITQQNGKTDMALIVYANESFDPDDPDTFYEQILE